MPDSQKEKIPQIVDIMHPMLRALGDLGGSGHVSEIDTRIAEFMKLPDEVLEYRDHKANKILYNWRCAWARTHLKSADAVENTKRGIWTITAKGRGLGPEKMREILNDSHRAARQRRSERLVGPSDNGDSIDDNIVERWEDELLQTLQAMSPDAFERLAQRILRESNFSKVEVTGRSGDGGIDGFGVLNVGLISFQVLFQCKRYKDTVSAGAIRDFRGAMVGRTDKGFFITTGRFTPDARKEATRDGAPPIDLIDGDQLCLLLKELGLGVQIELVESVQIRQEFFEQI